MQGLQSVPISVFGGKKKVRAMPANIEWNSVERLWYTSGGSMEGEVPQEFEDLDAKLKEMQTNFAVLCKLCKKQVKHLTAFHQANVAISAQLTEMSTSAKELVLYSSTLQKLAEAQTACEQARSDIRGKLQSRFMVPVDNYTTTVVNPARDAKKSWEVTKKDDLGISKSLETVIQAVYNPSSADALKLYEHLYNSRLSQTREETKYSEASAALLEAVWMRDFRFIQYCIDIMMDQHDSLLASYNSMYHIKAYEEKLLKDIATGRDAAERKRKQEQDAYELKLKEQEDGRYDALVEVLSQPDLGLMNSICVTASTEQDEILRTIIRILDAHSKTIPIIKQSITNEVAATQNPATLFRGNSTATKLMSAFTKMTGREYLLTVIKPLIEEVCSSQVSCEVDATKLKEGETVEANMENLMLMCQKFLDAIMRSADNTPMPFKEMLEHLQKEVIKRFPTAGYIAVAGFIFLRFFCPAISTPESLEGISMQINPVARRSLVLISKVIQCLANGAKFGQKEAFMIPCNSFLETNQQACNNFLAALAQLPQQLVDQKLCSLDEARTNDLPLLHRKIVQNLDLITKSLASYKNEILVEPLISILGDIEYWTGDINVEIISAKPPKKK